MEKVVNTRIQVKKDTQSAWESANPVLLDGEEILVVCTDGVTRKKVGDGSSTYSSLPYSTFGMVPTERTINGMALTKNISLTAGAIGAATTAHTHSIYMTKTDYNSDAIERILMYGMVYSTKTVSSDQRTITSVDENGLTLTKTFNEDFTVSTSILEDSNGTVLGQLTKTISPDGTVSVT